MALDIEKAEVEAYLPTALLWLQRNSIPRAEELAWDLAALLRWAGMKALVDERARIEEDIMKKHSDNTPTFNDDERVKVSGQEGSVERTLEDGRVMVKFDSGARQPVEPDKIER